jgi:hypothetical protein
MMRCPEWWAGFASNVMPTTAATYYVYLDCSKTRFACDAEFLEMRLPYVSGAEPVGSWPTSSSLKGYLRRSARVHDAGLDVDVRLVHSM